MQQILCAIWDDRASVQWTTEPRFEQWNVALALSLDALRESYVQLPSGLDEQRQRIGSDDFSDSASPGWQTRLPELLAKLREIIDAEHAHRIILRCRVRGHEDGHLQIFGALVDALRDPAKEGEYRLLCTRLASENARAVTDYLCSSASAILERAAANHPNQTWRKQQLEHYSTTMTDDISLEKAMSYHNEMVANLGLTSATATRLAWPGDKPVPSSDFATMVRESLPKAGLAPEMLDKLYTIYRLQWGEDHHEALLWLIEELVQRTFTGEALTGESLNEWMRDISGSQLRKEQREALGEKLRAVWFFDMAGSSKGDTLKAERNKVLLYEQALDFAAGHSIGLRFGAAAGKITIRVNPFLGIDASAPTVNYAARLEPMAKTGELLVDKGFADLILHYPDYRCIEAKRPLSKAVGTLAKDEQVPCWVVSRAQAK